ncbi:hypothetical protein [Desulfopila inferna]|uniref:hypothetical protein n=1 Tax=Desulfopila inferna TaxID=468528 RepID=UPI0019637FA1|nr:hypothetical protein [Desulfopila inferna]MBM9605957.1 hypothetical protein [Desulfopila inferna]
MSALAPLKSTLRVLEWDELPAQARDIPDEFDPLAEGVLMRHQSQWLAIKAALKVCPKGRRTGITFCQALDDTITAGSRRSAGGDNVYYIGDTKDKGLEFIGYCAKFARVIAEAQGQGVSGIEEFLFEDQDEKGNSRHINAYRIRFSSGYQIVALSSRPANIRGLQGKVRIDEAAFHADVQGVLDAATALLIWGGEIVIISSHNGKNNPFNQLIKDIEAGRYGENNDAVVFTVTFDQAVENGLYERVCMMKGWTPTPAEKEKWYKRIRSAYGPRKAAMREELDVIPRDSGGVCIPGVWIERAMAEERKILRLHLDDDFVRKPEGERMAWGEKYILKFVMPLLESLDLQREHVLGMDFARHRHFSVLVPLAIQQNLDRKEPFAVELNNVPNRQQEQILWAIIKGLPKFRGAALDATGPGQQMAEYTADKFGHNIIHQVALSRTWYGAWMPKMITRFEDGNYDLIKDASHEQDLRTVEEIDGIPMVGKIERKDLQDPDLVRHGDFAIGLALAEYAALNKGGGKPRYESVSKRRFEKKGMW